MARKSLISICALLFSSSVMAMVLPAALLRPEVCQLPAAQHMNYWQEQVANTIDEYAEDQHPAIQNALVTLGYLEIHRLNGPQATRFMGYVYANASHHLGRLVRYHQWTANDELGKQDKALIRGAALLQAVKSFPHLLPTKLMHYSLELYKTLAPPLLVLNTCGKDMLVKLTQDTNLLAASLETDGMKFAEHFIAFEQTYLQKTMYQDFTIATAAKTGVLDQMRFISFNGEEKQGYKSWCEETNCRRTSFDLVQRIAFDRAAVKTEWETIAARLGALESRLQSTQLEAIAYLMMAD